MQSSLAPAGEDADRIARLFWWMTGAGTIIWLAVLALAVYCVRLEPPEGQKRQYATFVIGGGVVVPTVLLTILLIYGLAILPPAVARAPEGSLQIAVTGEQWWWRVRYLPPGGGAPIDLANEVRLPVGEPVQFTLASDNVIHSFWIPSLAGKMDMIPGRLTQLTIRPTTTGVFRGACAEYCGTSHALMAFYAEVMEREAFDAWLAREAAPAVDVTGAEAVRGRDVFFANGCDACHTIRGSGADGVIGPDLTHVGSRLSLAAGILPNDADAFRAWVASSEHIKPGAQMPRFDMLPDADLRAVAAYLEALK